MPVYLYTLFCNDDYKYFVGASNRIIADPLIHFKRENDHFDFLEDHPMTEVISREKVQSLDQLDTKVLELMSLNGILNVRGGSYMTLSKDVITSLLNMDFAKQKKMCVLCTSKSHSTKKCNTYNSDDDSDYVPSVHSESDDDDSALSSEEEEEEENKDDDIDMNI